MRKSGKKAAKRKSTKAKKGRKIVVRKPKTIVAVIPESIGSVIAEAVARGISALPQPKIELAPAKQAPDKPEVRLAQIGADQRFTKNIGNYETFVFGFSLSIPVPIDAADNIETPETRDKLRPKYLATMGFINEMMKEVGKEIDVERGAAQQ